jgi:hypothetical protein
MSDHSHDAVDWDGKAFIYMLTSMVVGCTIIFLVLY